MSDASRKVDLHAPPEVVWIARTLEARGFSAWAVGGAVRDALNGGHPEDWDLTTSARPRDVQRIFRRTVGIWIDHGTVGVIGRSGVMYEVTTFRRDVETDGRRARVAFSDSLEEDLARRDFTINAVAWHPLTGEVVDPHGGMRDLEAGVLRAVGDPHLRFAEDRLRVLRGLRFAGTFALRIDDATWAGMTESSSKLGSLSAERIREELWKVLGAQRRPSMTLQLYARSGVLRALYPELEGTRGVPLEDGSGDLWEFLLAATDAAKRVHHRVRLAALLHRLHSGAAGDPAAAAAGSAALARGLLQRIRASNADVDRITHLIAQHAPLPEAGASDAKLRRWIRRVDPAYLRDLFRLRIAIVRAHPDDRAHRAELATLYRRTFDILRARPPLAVRDLAIDGGDLRAAGLRPGPHFGEILADLLEVVTEDPALNEREGLLERVRERSREQAGG